MLMMPRYAADASIYIAREADAIDMPYADTPR